MEIEFDKKKNALNLAKHGVELDLAALLFQGEFAEKPDSRKDYGERRIAATGFIFDRLYVCVYTWREKTRRIISLRKANRRERNGYYQS